MAIDARAAARVRIAQQPATVIPTEGTPRWTCTISMPSTT